MAAEERERFDWGPVLAVSIALFVMTIDTTIMNVAITAVVKEMNTTVSAVQAAISIFPMVMAALVLTAGKIGQIYGVKRWLTIGMFLFGTGGLVAAFSPNVAILTLGWSIIEGIGAAFILPLGFALVFHFYKGRQRALAFGVMGGVQASGAAFGPIVGGFLTTFLTWRLGFGLHILWISIAYFFFLRKTFVQAAERTTTRVDWIGTLLSSLGISAIVLGSIMAGRYGWWTARRVFIIGGLDFAPYGLSITPVLLVIGIVLLVALAHWQVRRERQGETPLFSIDLLKNGYFMVGVATDTLRQLYIAGLFFAIPLFLQSVLGFNALDSGLALLPLSLMGIVFSFGASRLDAYISPKRLIQSGVIVLGVGLLLLYNVTSLEMTLNQMIFPMAVIGAGLGITIAQMVNLTLSTVEPGQVSEASGVHNTFRELGNSLGTAVIGSLLLSFFYGGIVDGILRAESIFVTASERSALIVDTEDLFAALEVPEAAAELAHLPLQIQRNLVIILETSTLEAQKNAILAIFCLSVFSLLIATFLPSGKTDAPPVL